ncbi:MAG TPA: cytochrome b/b6 domain-containing protein [Usitatibacter sp.]|nr:cytochrome b/b6 domain-containing protein [Usitatibacter sp.]
MSEPSRPERYGVLAQVLHWTTAVLVVVAFSYGPGGSEQRVYSAAKDFDRQLHETLGFAILALSVARVLWRLVDVRPGPPSVPRSMELAAKAVQALLYALLFALPLTSVAGAWLEGHPLTLLAGVRIDPWIGPSHDLGHALATVHGWLGDAILWLAGFHAAAAIYHHAVLRDGVLLSMLPAGWLASRRKDGYNPGR